MAKLKAPLFSFEARGALAKSLVYFPWKGISAVRSYVIPANPNTTSQDAQRTKLENAVDEWHAASYNALDVTAWNRLATIATKTMSGFNRMAQEHILQAILGNVWTRINHGGSYGVLTTSFKVGCTKAAAGPVPTVRWGTSKTAMLSSNAMANIGGDDWEYTIPALTKDTLYYFTIDVGVAATTWGRLGIYSQRTAAA